MSRTPAEIEVIVRLFLQGKSHGEIGLQLYGDKKNRLSLNVVDRLKKKILNLGDIPNDKLLETMQRQGFTLSLEELLVIKFPRPVKMGRPTRKPAHKPSNPSWGHGSFKGNAKPTNASALTPAEPTPATITNEWLLREGVPYNTLAEDACSQPVGNGKNVCGNTISAYRFQRGFTTCQKCHDAVRQPNSELPAKEQTYYTRLAGR
ncbi:MAG: hypothetical protein WAX89_05190 [Alphaproteobacteria bacterium]